MLWIQKKGGIKIGERKVQKNGKHSDTKLPVNPKSIVQPLRKTILPYFPSDPFPLEKPSLDEDFRNFSHVERVAESIRYNILCLEFSISPKGGLRQWIKVNIALSLLIGIPVLVFMPIITYLIGGVAEISELLADASQYLLQGALNILKLVGVIIAAILGLIILMRILRL